MGAFTAAVFAPLEVKRITSEIPILRRGRGGWLRVFSID
jgi:hypothetical protein